jgi:predicted MFS family arabinose efflux permease
LFSIPSVGGSYWMTFFPAVVVLGLGMAVSVAPLTTVVMDSVDEDRVGTASGINNAVARISGMLAIALLGVLMVASFGKQLNRRLTTVQMPGDVRAELQSNESRLAALTVSEEVGPATANAIKAAISFSFVASFRLVMWLCTAMALVGAVVSWWTIPRTHLPGERPEEGREPFRKLSTGSGHPASRHETFEVCGHWPEGELTKFRSATYDSAPDSGPMALQR